MKLKLILCLCMLPLFCLAQEAQPQQFSNRYGMKMTQNEDGSMRCCMQRNMRSLSM